MTWEDSATQEFQQAMKQFEGKRFHCIMLSRGMIYVALLYPVILTALAIGYISYVLEYAFIKSGNAQGT